MPPPAKKPKKELKPLSTHQFSFFPNSTSATAPSASTSASTSKKNSASSSVASGSSSPVKKAAVSNGKGKGKAVDVDIIDLTEEDELEFDMPPPPKPSRARPAPPSTNQSSDEALWVDKYGPTSREDLAVHAKKVTDVQNWMEEAFNPKLAKYRRVLVMSGPSGAAKTATLTMLAKEMGVSILEYRNGGNLSFAHEEGRESLVSQFTNFLVRAGMAPALDLGPDPSITDASPSSSSTSTSQPNPSQLDPSQKRLILLEDLPNTSHYPTKLALRSAIMQYLSSPRVTCPLVIIISEALARPGGGFESESMSYEGGRGESVDSRSVCGIEVLLSPGCREISFNPIATTIMKKGLNKILDRVYSSSSSSSRPSVATLDLIIKHSNGDIRSALMSLQFLASNEELSKKATSLGVGGSTAGKGKKRKSDGKEVRKGGREDAKKLLQFVTARESSLFIFHALGKVLYSKRWGQSADDDKKDLDRPGIVQDVEKPPKLPKHLREELTRPVSKVNPDVLFAEAPIDSDVFLSYMHHNYLQFTNEIEQCERIADGISSSDAMMRAEGEEWLTRAPLTSQYSFNLAVRSTLFYLPDPVPRNRQTLRKSYLWEQTRLTKENMESVRELLGNGRGTESEKVPFLGKQPGANAFLRDLATFPVVKGSGSAGRDADGEALGEKEIENEEDFAEEEEDGTQQAREDGPGDEVLVKAEAVEETWWDEDDDIEE